MGEIACENENSELSEAEQKDLFGEPVISVFPKQIPHRSSNIRRERFVREYVLCGRNATEAAFRAGYAEGNRKQCEKYGSWLLKQPDVQECLSHFSGVLLARDLIRADELVEDIKRTLDQMEKAGKAHLRNKEGLYSLLARMGGHLEGDKVQVNNILGVRDLVALDIANSRQGESGEFSRGSAGSGETSEVSGGAA